MFSDIEQPNNLNKDLYNNNNEPDLNDRVDEEEEAASPTLATKKEPLNITDMQDHFIEIMNSE